MESIYVISQSDARGREDSLERSDNEDSKQLVRRLNQDRALNINSIPRRVVNFDEKYLRRCLELIHVSAAKAATCKISVNYGSILVGGSNLAETKGDGAFDTARFVFECPLVGGVGSVAIQRPAGQGIIGSVMGSKSMENLLKSPLYCKSRRMNFEQDDDKAVICYNVMNSSGGSSNLSPPHQLNDTPILENHKLQSWSHQGTLQCTWRGGSPRFIFSVDGEKEVYVASLAKVGYADGKAMYLLHSNTGTRKGNDVCDVEPHSRLVGKIEVSTSFTVGPNDSKIKETEFVLYGNNENHTREIIRKRKALSKKVADVFKQKTTSKLSGPDTSDNTCDDNLGEVDLLEKNLPPNFELAAIVVRDRMPDERKREVGGWGMKFLKNNTGTEQTINSPDSLMNSDCRVRNTGDCSVSMDVIVPAGLHGGPRTRHGGPSGLIERWKRGSCECGGWDMGCLLTVLNTQPNIKPAPHNQDAAEKCMTFDLLVKGSEQSGPRLRMVNVHDGLYLIDFESILSVAQCFSIAVASVHGRSPNFGGKYV